MKISNNIELIHVPGGKTHPRGDDLGKGRFVAMRGSRQITPVRYKSIERAVNDLRNLRFID